MPAKNAIKTYVEDAYYHVYNRGVEKRKIFQDVQDHKVFLNYLKEHLSPPINDEDKKEFSLRGKVFKGVARKPKNYSENIQLIAYCLMPNHFHFLLKQNTSDSMEKLMRSLLTRYSMYFNKKYSRVGSLFQGPYKASLIVDDNYLLHLSRYIHLNPRDFNPDIVNSFSSYGDYLHKRQTAWVKPEIVLNFFEKSLTKEFKKINTYKDFVEKYKNDSNELPEALTLE